MYGSPSRAGRVYDTPMGLPSAEVLAPRLRRASVVLLALGAVQACDQPTDPGDGIATIAISVPSTVLRPGYLMYATAEPRDANGVPVEGREIRWRSLDAGTLAVGADGRVLALAPGIGRLRASVGSVSSVLQLSLVNPPAVTLTNSSDTVRLLVPSGQQSVTAVARDAEGTAIFHPTLDWESTAPRIAAIADNGAVSAVSVGTAFIVAHVEGLTDTSVVIVSAPESPNAPSIDLVEPSVALPGQVLQLTGQRFAPTPAGNAVLINGTPVTVVGASLTQLTLTLPPATQFECVRTGPVNVQVTTSGGVGVGSVTLQMAAQRALLPGQSVVVPGGLESSCLELFPAAGRYVITAQNTARVIGTAPGAFSVRGFANLEATSQARAEDPWLRTGADAGLRARALRRPAAARSPAAARRQRAHAALLRANREGALRAAASPVRAAPALAKLVVPVLGSLQPVRVPNLESATRPCASYHEIGTRTAFVGPHIAILEDTAPLFDGLPTLRGQLDDLYALIGAEFETAVWPTLQVFGNPLVKDDRLDDNGRIVVVFTPRMNELLGGALLAATTTCDLYPRQTGPDFVSSNVGEYVYAQVPVSPDPGTGLGTRERWLWAIRGTLAHELKHVVSYAERTVRNWVPEEDWLEEATARHAEELFARRVYGTTIRANHGFDATLACESRFGLGGALPGGCAGQPRAMLPHFEGLWDFLDASTTLSPLGPVTTGDFSYYGSAWSLTRWILDHSGLTEEAFFQAITLSPTTGIANLESRVGRSWQDLVGEWSLTLAVDDQPGLVPEVPRLAFASWDLPSVFQGLCDVLGSCVAPPPGPSHYPRPHPLQRIPVSVGAFTVEFPEVNAGGFGVLELSGGNDLTRQLVSLRGYRGNPLPAESRFSIIRVE